MAALYREAALESCREDAIPALVDVVAAARTRGNIRLETLQEGIIGTGIIGRWYRDIVEEGSNVKDAQDIGYLLS